MYKNINYDNWQTLSVINHLTIISDFLISLHLIVIIDIKYN